MRQSEYRKKVTEASEIELEVMLKDEREGLYKMRQQLALTQLENPKATTMARKNVARIHSELGARKIKASKGS